MIKQKINSYQYGTGKLTSINAFTLVELIIVITILAILGTISFISLQGYSVSARDSTRISDIGSMKSSLELFQLDSGNYPQPSDGVNITYSGSTVWSQGTFGESVFTNVDRLDKIPTDPLTDKLYTYSVTSTKNQYQIGGMMEGDEISMNNEQGIMNNIVSLTNAGNVEAKAYISGTYNGQMTKVLSGTTCNVLAIPSIMTNDVTTTDLQQIVSSGSLVYRGYKNLPASFNGSKFKIDGGFDYQPNILIAYSDTGSCEQLIDTNTYTARVNLLKGLQDAYSGTLVQNEGEIKNIVTLTIDINNPSSEVINYAGNYVNNVLKGKISVGGNGGQQTVTYSNCTTTTQSGYTIPQINHGINNQLVNKTITNGSSDIQVSCNDGILSYGTETINCDSNYIVSGNSCVLDTCTGTMPANAELNGTQGTAIWVYSTAPGVCKYQCQGGYHTEDSGTTCTSDTRSCVIVNGTGEQNWNGSSWGTCSVVSCNSNYVQSGNTCVLTNYPGCNEPDIPFGGYTIAACNVGTNISGTGSSSYGYYFQWGNNGGRASGSYSPASATPINTSTYGPSNYYSNTAFIGGGSFGSPYDWSSPQNNNLWGNTGTTSDRQGPCASGYHVPTSAEWTGIKTAGGWTNNPVAMSNSLRLPFTGFWRFSDGIMMYQGQNSHYWSSDTTGIYAYDIYLDSTTSIDTVHYDYRGYGFTVRCFKN